MNLTTYHPLAGQAVTLYQQGYGLRIISAKLRQPKTSVRRWLIEAGVYDTTKAREHYAAFRAAHPPKPKLPKEPKPPRPPRPTLPPEVKKQRQREAARRTYLKNREKRLAYAREQYARLRQDEYFLKSQRERAKRYRQRKPEIARQAIKNWKSKNRNKERAWVKDWHLKHKHDPKFRIVNNLRRRLKEFLRHKIGLTSSALFGCKAQQLRAWLESKFRDGMTWQNYGAWHIDHIMPCASFDLSDREQQRRCFHYTNLQPLWAEDNMRKGATTPGHPRYLMISSESRMEPRFHECGS